MADTTADTTPTTAETADTPVAASEVENIPEVEPARAETDWKAEARKWEERAKANRAAVKERDALAEALKSKDADLDELRGKVSAFEHAREVEAWKTQVAADTDVPAHLLRGETLEDLQAHAEALKEAFTKQRPRGPLVPQIADTPAASRSGDMSEVSRQLFGHH